MNPLVNVDVSMHFEISNSQMFGGKGSVGYTSLSFGGVGNLKAIDDSFIETQIKGVANMMKVTNEEVKLISKAEYDFETDEDEDEDGDY